MPDEALALQRPAEAHFRKISASEPSYGGHYFDVDGNLIAYTTDPTRATAIEQLLRPILDRAQTRLKQFGERRSGRVLIKPAIYTFHELSGWRDQLTAYVLPMPGVVYTGLDEVSNRVRIGLLLTDPEARARVLSRLTEIGVPEEAVTFADVSAFESNASARLLRQPGTLVESIRPLQAGYRLSYFDGQQWGCTIGLVSRDTDFNPVALTSTHCSRAWGEMDSGVTLYFQPNDPSQIGQEIDDYHYLDCTGGLPGTHKCLYADALIVGLTEAPNYYTMPMVQLNTINVHGSNIWTVTWEFAESTSGVEMHKIGQATGYRIGQVLDTCDDYKVSFFGDRYLICQDAALYHADDGDSGAPVFGLDLYCQTCAVMAGMHSGRYYLAGWPGTLKTVFSPMSGIRLQYPQLELLPQ